MDKDQLERELEKADKGCVITIVNQSSASLHLDSSKHQHGKFKSKLPKTIIARETASFSLAGKKSIDASVRFRWGKGKLELFWSMPEQGDPKVFYKVGAQLKDKLFVNIPSAVFGKITKFIFLVDEKPMPGHSDVSQTNTNTDTNDDMSSENFSDAENDLSNASTASKKKDTKDDDDESKGADDPNSFGFSSDEEDEPKKINIVIKPKSETPLTDTVVVPAIGFGPPGGGGVSKRRNRAPTSSSLFPDLNEQMFQIGSPPNPTPATARSPIPLSSPASPISSISSGSPPRERRLSFSSDFDRNKFAPNPAVNSSPLDGFFGLSTPLSPNLVPPPHLNTPPLNSPKTAPLPSATPLAPTRPPSRPASPTLQQLSPATPTPISRMTGRSSFEFGRISIEDLNALSSGLGAATPLTPKPSPMDFNSLASRAPAQQPSLNVPFPSSTSSMPKSPPQITPTGGNPPSSAAVLIPNRPTPNFTSNQVVPSPSRQYSLTPASSSPSRIASAYTTLSPPLSRHSPARNASPFDENQGIQRRFSEPPPVDANLLFPELARIKDNNKKADVLEPAKKYMYSAMLHLEKNSIPAALGNLDLCISVLATLPIEAAAELEYSAKYRLFLILLKEIAKPIPPIEHAFLSFFLSDISVKPSHRVIAIRMAIRHNMNSGNYGIAAALIQLLVDRIHPVDENVLLEKLRKCAGAGKTNSDKRFKTYMCPACDKTNNVNSTKCSLCLQPIRFCALTLEIIATKAYYSCKLCKLNFSRKAISPRDSDLKCPFCKVGDLTNKAFVVNK